MSHFQLVKVPIQNIEHFPKEFSLPEYMSLGAAGLDLRAVLTTSLTLAPLQRVLVPTGIAIAVPEGFEVQLRPRSGLAIKKGLTLLNTPGTIDSDYRGEIKVIIVNLGEANCVIEHGERIAQMIFAPVAKIQWQEVSELPQTARGEGGFGHTGRH